VPTAHRLLRSVGRTGPRLLTTGWPSRPSPVEEGADLPTPPTHADPSQDRGHRLDRARPQTHSRSRFCPCVRPRDCPGSI